MFKRRWATLAAASMLTLAAACTNSSTPSSNNGAQGSGAAQPTASAASEASPQAESGFKFHKYDPPIQLEFHASVGADVKWREGESIDNNEFIRWAKEELGIEWKTKFVTPTNDEARTKLNLAMTSDTLPDAILAETPQLGTLASQGYLTPLNELIEQYGSPLLKDRIKAAMDASGDRFFDSYTLDGHIYALPIDADIWGRTYYNTFIRKDILDGLGQEVPQTLTQFEDVLAAYKAKHPDGVGVFLQKDLVPAGLYQMSPAMQPHGAYPGRWLEGADGKLVYGSTLPEVKQGLETLRKWYANGWIDREFIVKDGAKATEQMAAGDMLSMTGDWWHVYYPLPDTVKNAPEAVFATTSLQGPDGKSRLVTGNPFNYAVGISSKSKHPEAFIHQLNEMVDSALRQDLELRDRMLGEAGYTFKYPVEDASARIAINPDAPQELQEYNVTKPGPRFFRTTVHTKYYAGFQFLGEIDTLYSDLLAVGKAAAKGSPDGLAAHQQQTYNDMVNNGLLSALGDEMATAERIRGDMELTGFLGAPTATMVEKNAYLLKLENETFAKIITGSAELDEFDRFVASWLKAGGEQITQEVNDWRAKSR